jgi:hypothetical protein
MPYGERKVNADSRLTSRRWNSINLRQNAPKNLRHFPIQTTAQDTLIITPSATAPKPIANLEHFIRQPAHAARWLRSRTPVLLRTEFETAQFRLTQAADKRS